jgi:hypothetical protein
MKNVSLLLLVFLLPCFLSAVPVPYAGKVAINGENFNGTAKFAFELRDADGTVHWRNGADANASIEVHVDRGHYVVLLGGQGMAPITPRLFLDEHELYLKVRVDLSDGNGMRHLAPDQRITATPYALAAEVARSVLPGAVKTDQLNESILKYLKPEITSHPESQTVFSRSTFTLSATAEGKYLDYQWKRNGQVLAGETNATLVITDANGTLHDGNYSVLVSNDFGSVTTNHASIKVNATNSKFLTRVGTRLYLNGEEFRALGLSEPDLFLQFLGIASGHGSTNHPYPPVEEQIKDANDSMDDAVKEGFTMFRIMGMPYYPNQLKKWLDDPVAYWSAFDAMVAGAKSRGIRLVPMLWWNVFVFSDLANEPLGRTFEKGSYPRFLLFEYAREIAHRYRDEETILFWELTGEINLDADLDFGHDENRSKSRVVKDENGINYGTRHARSKPDNFSTDEMVATVKALAEVMKAEDPNHLISAGYSVPRKSAWRLRVSPEWNGADWTPDTKQEMEAYVELANPDPIDFVSVHFYNSGNDNERHGISGQFNPDLLKAYVDAANRIEKPLFVGEFGDGEPTVSEERSANFTRRTALKILELGVPVSTLWAWQFYQFDANQSSPHSVDPNEDSDLIDLLKEVNDLLGDDTYSGATPLSVTNPSFELDEDGSGRPDGWELAWRNGTSIDSNVSIYSHLQADQFEGNRTIRLTNGTGDANSSIYVLSDQIPVAGGHDVILSAAVRRHLAPEAKANLSIIEKDSENEIIGFQEITLGESGGWKFKVEHLKGTLKQNTKKIEIRFAVGGAENQIIDIDDVRLMQLNSH